MKLRTIKSRLTKYCSRLSQLNTTEGWGIAKSMSTYLDFLGAFIRHGCLIDQYVDGRFYTFKNYYRKRVITQRRLEKIIKTANAPESIHLLENKAHFNKYFSKWVRRDWLLSEAMSFEEFKSLCLKCRCLFVKPLDAYEGKGVQCLKSPSDENGIRDLYKKFKRGRLIIEQRVEQHHGLIFGNYSVNTVRINTILDKNGEVHFFKPVLRVGIGDAVVDNYNAGGVEYAVDLESGIIFMPGYYKGSLCKIFHPETTIRMVGYQLPLWKDVLSNVAEAARLIPNCRYVGWDVAITPEGIELIEGNHNPGYVCMEYFGETGWYKKLKKYL